MVQEFLGFHGFSFDDDIDGIAISSVVPRATAAFREMTERYFGFRPVVIEPGVRTGMPVLTDNPREVGADRIANAVAAIDLYGGPAVVIDFGTATTYDAISAQGELLGCAIAPGIDISLDALYQPGRRTSPHRAGRAPQRDRSDHRRRPPGRRRLRLRRPGRRHRRPHGRRARPGQSTIVATGGLAATDRALHQVHRAPSSPGSPSTACDWCSPRTVAVPGRLTARLPPPVHRPSQCEPRPGAATTAGATSPPTRGAP